ncbi:hypothetical protein EVAR_31338_1 [Eumeta japonica]|uniref:Uncharacterized protein n=1 Tax=Eumeta variegata TaxID=151549 RepID=A0A4C1XXM4_EUMVA|nr:hypothetical protein EVAR_31338_1 [Eumeta japonica]
MNEVSKFERAINELRNAVPPPSPKKKRRPDDVNHSVMRKETQGCPEGRKRRRRPSVSRLCLSICNFNEFSLGRRLCAPPTRAPRRDISVVVRPKSRKSRPCVRSTAFNLVVSEIAGSTRKRSTSRKATHLYLELTCSGNFARVYVERILLYFISIAFAVDLGPVLISDSYTAPVCNHGHTFDSDPCPMPDFNLSSESRVYNEQSRE